MFQPTPGIVNNISTIDRSILALNNKVIETDFVLMDAGYVTEKNMEVLYEANIDFLTRLPERNKELYQKIMKESRSDLKKEENLVKYNGRAGYLQCVECELEKHRAYAYLKFDVEREVRNNIKQWID